MSKGPLCFQISHMRIVPSPLNSNQFSILTTYRDGSKTFFGRDFKSKTEAVSVLLKLKGKTS